MGMAAIKRPRHWVPFLKSKQMRNGCQRSSDRLLPIQLSCCSQSASKPGVAVSGRRDLDRIWRFNKWNLYSISSIAKKHRVDILPLRRLGPSLRVRLDKFFRSILCRGIAHLISRRLRQRQTALMRQRHDAGFRFL
jgi:hypothetical protein